MSLQVWLPLNGNLGNKGVGICTPVNSNCTVDSAGKIGSCYSFNGSISCIEITCSTFPTILSGPFSICMWVYNNDNNDRSILFGNWSLTGSFFNIEKFANNEIRFYWNGSPDLSLSPASLPLQTWTHLVVTRNGNIVKAYINGTLKKTSTTELTGSPASNATVFRLGRDNRSDTTAFNGKMNDFRLYDHELSDKEVKEISKGLIIHYPLNDLIGNPNEISNSMPYDNVLGYSPAGTGWGAPTLIDNDFSPSGKVVRSTYTGSGGNSGGIHHQPYDYSALENGAVYTFSVWVRASKPVPMNIYSEMMTSRSITMPITIGTEWTHVVISGPINNTAQYHSNVVYCSGTDVTTNMWIEAFGFKLEKGSKATPWIPHTTDAQYNIINSDISTCHDTSGYNNNGTMSSTKPTACGDTPRYFSGFQFSNNTYISSVTPTATIYTFSWWGNLNNVSGKMMWGYANGNRLNLYMSNGYFCWNTGDSENNKFGTISTASYADNNWHHFAITSDGATVKLYIDGVFKANATTYRAITGTSLIFNGWNTANDYNFNGKLSDFRLYMTCLSESDIKELYQSPIHIDNIGNLYTSEISEV